MKKYWKVVMGWLIVRSRIITAFFQKKRPTMRFPAITIHQSQSTQGFQRFIFFIFLFSIPIDIHQNPWYNHLKINLQNAIYFFSKKNLIFFSIWYQLFKSLQPNSHKGWGPIFFKILWQFWYQKYSYIYIKNLF